MVLQQAEARELLDAKERSRHAVMEQARRRVEVRVAGRGTTFAAPSSAATAPAGGRAARVARISNAHRRGDQHQQQRTRPGTCRHDVAAEAHEGLKQKTSGRAQLRPVA